MDIALLQRKLARFSNEMIGIVNELQQRMMDTMKAVKEMWERLVQNMRARGYFGTLPIEFVRDHPPEEPREVSAKDVWTSLRPEVARV